KVLAAIANEVPKDVSNACALYPSLCASPAATNGRGCCIGEKWASVLPAKYELLGSELKTTSGHPELDEVLAKVVATMSEISGVAPAAAFIEEEGGVPNAFAMPQVIVPGTDGTLLIGLALMRQIVETSDAPAVRMTAVCAHEFAHTVQFKRRQRIEPLSGKVK